MSNSLPPSTVVDHVVLLKVRPDVTPEEINRFVEGISSLKVIPGVLTITVGPSFAEEWMADRRGGFTHILSCRLASKEALKVYQDHDLHTKVKNECIAPIISAPPVAVDWESQLVIGESVGATLED